LAGDEEFLRRGRVINGLIAATTLRRNWNARCTMQAEPLPVKGGGSKPKTMRVVSV